MFLLFLRVQIQVSVPTRIRDFQYILVVIEIVRIFQELVCIKAIKKTRLWFLDAHLEIRWIFEVALFLQFPRQGAEISGSLSSGIFPPNFWGHLSSSLPHARHSSSLAISGYKYLLRGEAKQNTSIEKSRPSVSSITLERVRISICGSLQFVSNFLGRGDFEDEGCSL